MLNLDGRRPGRLGSRANLSRKRSLQRGPSEGVGRKEREWYSPIGNMETYGNWHSSINRN